jgi:NitT/TauT family transport system permease protein
MDVLLARTAAPGQAPAAATGARHGSPLVELVVLAGLAAVIAGIVALARRWHAPLLTETVIDLSPRALPGYTLLSLARGFAAYALSLAVTLVYGTAAAHSPRAARVLIPLLDVLQSIPVLGFLPGLVLGLVALFPHSNTGLELACVVMIFTGQAWNMIFSFYASLRGIPSELREAAAIFRLGRWQVFRTLEVPAATIGLVWNSMMSMAGGWFFLTVAEAFTLGDRGFRLPGVGAYMSVAIERGDTAAMTAAVVAMVLMILGTDQLVWRPLVAWAERFKLEETAAIEPPRSWVLALLARSLLIRRLGAALRAHTGGARSAARGPAAAWRRQAGRVLGGGALIAAGLAALAGALTLARLLAAVPFAGWARVCGALLATTLRTTAAVAAAALWTLPAGIAIGRSPRLARRLQPVIQTLASFPAPMLYPLVTAALLALHVPFTVVAAALMLLGAQWYVLFNVLAGASAIPTDLREAADTYRLGGWRRWRTLELPVVFPYLVTGLVTAAGGSWNASIVAEMVRFRGATLVAPGLGALITQATAAGDFPLLGAGVLTMAVAVVLINRFGWRRLYRLAETRYALAR